MGIWLCTKIVVFWIFRHSKSRILSIWITICSLPCFWNSLWLSHSYSNHYELYSRLLETKQTKLNLIIWVSFLFLKTKKAIGMKAVWRLVCFILLNEVKNELELNLQWGMFKLAFLFFSKKCHSDNVFVPFFWLRDNHRELIWYRPLSNLKK